MEALMNGMAKSGVVVLERDTALKVLTFMESVNFKLSDPPEVWEVAREIFEQLRNALEIGHGT